MHSCSRELVTNIFALQSVRWNPCQEVWVGGLGMRAGQVIVLCSWAKQFTLSGSLSNQAPVIWRVDCAIRWICHPLVDTLVGFFFTVIHRIVIYSLDSVICPLNNRAQEHKWVLASHQGGLIGS